MQDLMWNIVGFTILALFVLSAILLAVGMVKACIAILK